MHRFLKKATKLLKLLECRAWRRGLLFGVGAAIEHDLALGAKKYKTIVDVGANKGQFALYCLGRFPESNILSFEPLPEPASKFLAIFKSIPRVTLVKCAISTDKGFTDMHISKSDDSSSLLPIGELQDTLFPGTYETGTISVEMNPLELYLKPEEVKSPSLLKIDVQGFEYEALKGCEKLLKHFDEVYVECSYVELYEGQRLADDIIKYLEGKGFSKKHEYNKVVDPVLGPIQADFLFENYHSVRFES